jgi:hypothetical protein
LISRETFACVKEPQRQYRGAFRPLQVATDRHRSLSQLHPAASKSSVNSDKST